MKSFVGFAIRFVVLAVALSGCQGSHHVLPPQQNVFAVTGAPAPLYPDLDAQMQSFMQQHGIRAGQLAVARAGTVVFAHAYTNTSDPAYGITQPTSIMRVASNSKAIATAAMTKLFADGTLTPDTKVYPYLGVTAPLLPSEPGDPRANAITVDQLINHRAGLHDDTGSAPEFNMWSIEVQAGVPGPLTKQQFTAYLYGQPLGSTPGTTYVYSNDGYYLLARVVEKATGQNYIDWVNANVLAPIGIKDAVVSATDMSLRRPNETLYDDPGTGPSVLTPQSNVMLPYTYGGLTVYEDLDGAASIAISAQSLAKLAGSYNVFGIGPRRAGFWRSGSFPGTFSWLESLGDGVDYAFIFNSRVDQNGNRFDTNSDPSGVPLTIAPLRAYLNGHL